MQTTIGRGYRGLQTAEASHALRLCSREAFFGYLPAPSDAKWCNGNIQEDKHQRHWQEICIPKVDKKLVILVKLVLLPVREIANFRTLRNLVNDRRPFKGLS